MVYYGLMLPMLQDGSSFLVPSLLPTQPPALTVPGVRSHFYFAFGTKRKVERWQDDNHFSVVQATTQGFCPSGLFSRFSGKVISESQRTYSYFKSKCSRHETTTFFGKHGFTIRELKELNMIQVLVLVSNPRRLLDELSFLLQSTIDEMIPHLAFCTAVGDDGGTNPNFDLGRGEDAHLVVLSGSNGLIERCSNNQNFDAGEGPQSAVEIRRKFSLWLPPSGLRSSGYDVFLSYRWTGIDRQHWGFDEDLTMGIFNNLSMRALVGPDKREVNVFLDKQRLQPARDFQSSFVDALLNSALPVIVMSSAALLKMVSLQPDSPIDNLLLEWTIIADLHASGLIKQCLTVLFGACNTQAGSCADVLGDIFDQKMPEVLAAVEGDRQYDKATRKLTSFSELEDKNIFGVLPNIVVKSVNDKTRSMLQLRGLPVSPDIDSRSVRMVVDGLTKIMGVKANEEAAKLNSRHANDEALRAVINHCSNMVCSILEAEDAPVSANASTALASSSTIAARAFSAVEGAAVDGPPSALGKRQKVQDEGSNAGAVKMPTLSPSVPEAPSVAICGGVAISAQLLQSDASDDTEEANILQTLVGILARAGVVPVPKREEFARALYHNGISSLSTLKDSVVGDNPDVDLVKDICMNRVQKNLMIKFLADA